MEAMRMRIPQSLTRERAIAAFVLPAAWRTLMELEDREEGEERHEVVDIRGPQADHVGVRYEETEICRVLLPDALKDPEGYVYICVPFGYV